jgi:hypothetical protein
MQSWTREDMLALTAPRYLAEGYVGADGVARPELTGMFATAASTQFLAAELSPQELALTAEAVRQVLPLHAGDPATRAVETVEEALHVVANAIRQPSNEVMATWFRDCAQKVRTRADLAAFLAHVQAVEVQYGLVAGLSRQHASPPAA